MTFKMSKKLEREILSIARGEPLPYLKRMKGMRFRTASEIKPEIEREQARLQAYLNRIHKNRPKQPAFRLAREQRPEFMRLKMRGLSHIKIGEKLNVMWSMLPHEEKKICLWCARLYKKGKTMKEISIEVGITRKQIENTLKRQGLLKVEQRRK